MATIFVSYSHADEPFVRDLTKLLEEVGHSVVSAGAALTPGEMWQEVLGNLLRDADAVVIILSQASVQSQWLISEIGAALGYWKERGKPIILPVVLDNAELPPQLRHIQAIFQIDRDPQQVAAQLTRALDSLAGRLKAREEERKEAKSRVERTAAKYIQRSLSELKKREERHLRFAIIWYGAALLSLVSGLGFGIWRALRVSPEDPSWTSITQFAIASIIVIGLLGALSRFAFVLGKSFMVESLRNADRIHAISFGEFYLEAFPEQAEWQEIKEAFQHWNIDIGSSFIQQTVKDIDPEILQTAIEIAKAIRGKDEK